MTLTEAIGIIIKTERKRLGYTQLRVVADSGLATTPSLLSRYETGDVEAKTETMARIVAVLGLTMADLMARAEAMVSEAAA